MMRLVVMRWGWLVITTLLLSGCMTALVNTAVSKRTAQTNFYRDDVISGFSVARDNNNKQGWVIIGQHFDYLLESGSDEKTDRLLTLLVKQQLDKSRLEVFGENRFTIEKPEQKFRGQINVRYHWQGEEEREKLENAGKNLGRDWYCYYSSQSRGGCDIMLNSLSGTIHKKAPTPADIFHFQHPFEVKFYKYKKAYALYGFYPMAIAADVVASPLYILASPFAILAIPLAQDMLR